MDSIQAKFKEFDDKIVHLTETLAEKTSKIKELEEHLEKCNFTNLVTDIIKKSDIIEKLEMNVKEVAENNFILVHAVDDQERATKSLQNELKILLNQSSTYACNVCSQTFTSETMLRNHIRRYHGTFGT